MSFWKKEKNKEIEGSVSLTQAIHTMQDDLEGRAPISVSTTVSANAGAPVNGIRSPFQESEESVPRQAKAPENLPTNPFLGSENPAETAPTQTSPAFQTNESNVPVASQSAPAEAPAKPKKLREMLVMIGVILLIVLLSGGVYYYFFVWKAKTAPDVGESISNLPQDSPKDISDTQTDSEEKPSSSETPRFSATTPNLLSINTETVTTDGLRTQLLETAQKVKEEGLSGGVEFLVRDQNYNPLAFSRFAYLAKVSLAPTLVSQLDEDFSLFVYIDQERPHLGLSVKIKNQALFQPELVKAERNLPQDLQMLYVDTTTASKTGLLFKSGSYGIIPTRYANVDSSINLSLDYAVKDGRWSVGTSRDTLRAILDKSAVQPAPSQSAAPEIPKNPAQ